MDVRASPRGRTRSLDARRSQALAPKPAVGSPPRGQTLATHRERVVHVVAIDRLPLGSRTLEHAREPLEARLRQKGCAARAADLAVAEVLVAVDVGAERRLRVVDVQRPEAVEPDDAVELVEHPRERLGTADVVARREQVAGVEADGGPLAAAGQLDQPRQLLERAPERAARAGGVLEVQRAAVRLRERLGDHRGGALDRGVDCAAALERRPGVEHDPDRAQLLARAQRRRQRRERLLPEVRLLRGRIQQVHRVDQERVDVRVRHRRPEVGDLLRRVLARLPLARVLVEDLDRAGAALDAALDGLRRPAGGGDVGTDQHGGRAVLACCPTMRVRFAPSPTGALHIGGARTALYNWLLARGREGELVLRIEDTDRERSTPENVAQILDALRWLELGW